MIENFLADYADYTPDADPVPDRPNPLPDSRPDREQVRITILGSLEEVNGIIYTLHLKRLAEVNE